MTSRAKQTQFGAVVERRANTQPRNRRRVPLRQMALAAGFQPKTHDAVVIVDGATFG